jgi:hypothetical protein
VLADDDTWQAIKDAGPIIASVVALAIAVTPPVWRYVRRPRLWVRITDVEPHTRQARSADNVVHLFLRMQVLNKGNIEARRVRAVVHEWYERPDATVEWHRRDMDPAALHWVSMPQAGQTRREPAINLPRGLWDFADLVRYTPPSNTQVLVVDDTTPRGFWLMPTNSTGEFVLTVTISAENARPEKRHVHYSLSPERRFHDVRIDKSPPRNALFMGDLTMAKEWERRASARRSRPGGPTS